MADLMDFFDTPAPANGTAPQAGQKPQGGQPDLLFDMAPASPPQGGSSSPGYQQPNVEGATKKLEAALEDGLASLGGGGGKGKSAPTLKQMKDSNPNKENYKCKLWDVQTHYEVMGVAPNASIEEIDKVYKKKSRSMHPDLNPNQSEEDKATYAKITEAAAVLRNEESRAEYDRAIRQAGMQTGAGMGGASPMGGMGMGGMGGMGQAPMGGMGMGGSPMAQGMPGQMGGMGMQGGMGMGGAPPMGGAQMGGPMGMGMQPQGGMGGAGGQAMGMGF